ncbi:uncharacterized protein LOC131644531 [Vicia villosa]|uniref:uncharacterized protein LOC131644531 n=1 Tax=Vicia villosa TaxID=3911 RepID=UPI00273BAE76|nr:uncharacterized protein LOC131644531 [Vicia villosa]XP_058771040.1 uncharacterized protein LOC131644531 [Vicia villosa]
MDKEGGGYGIRPPILDGSNYDYWKPRMVAFLKFVDSKAGRAVNKGWEHPVITEKDGKKTLKLEEEWDKDEEALALGNSKALNALFNGIDKNIFRLVHQCELAKDVWDTLKTTHEGTSKVKMSRLQLLTTKFENLRMRDDESIKDFHMNILDIANTSGALGEKMSDEKLVRKILRSLPKRFDMKVTAIEEAQDISKMKVEELIGSLQTFEMGISENSEKKNKSIAFVSNSQEEVEESREENLSESIAMLGKQFNKIIRRMDQKPRPNVKNISSDTNRSYDSGRRAKPEEKYNHSKGIQCHGCEGYGHIRAECPTYLKKQKKGLSVSWSDEDSGSDFEEESAKHVTAFTGVCNFDEDSSDDELTFEELAASYRKLCIRSAEVCQQSETQKKYIAQLEADNKGFSKTISELNNEIIMLQSKLDQMSKSVKMLNSGSDMLDEILQIGKSSGDMSGIGFVGTKKPPQDGNRIKPETEMLNPMSRHATQHQDRSKMKRKFQRWRCHHCGRFGHIKPFCFRLYGYPDQAPYYRPKQVMPIQKPQWIPKNMALIAHTSLRVSAKEDWYFDSGCSRHMTGIKNLLVDIRNHATSYVTFGDGAKGEIKGVGKLNCSGVPNLEGVLLVKGLTANLISIIQLCDQGYQVNFTRAECVVTDEGKNVIMRGVRSKDNCYLWTSHETNYSSVCSKEEEAKLWHQKLGHLHLRGMKKIISTEAVRGIPKLQIDEGRICGECQVGKQTRMSHPKVRHLTTSRVLELLHMDLMGPMQMESLGGKKYAYVVVDDYSRYTWINFIREKSDVFDVFKDLCQRI